MHYAALAVAGRDVFVDTVIAAHELGEALVAQMPVAARRCAGHARNKALEVATAVRAKRQGRVVQRLHLLENARTRAASRGKRGQVLVFVERHGSWV